ncbi:MAG: fumarylacetoacetate hydrolase family protein [Proteobacteria bacterium]|nr:fumarylacetoacetate hydrolase family protein [Pseudomonadota bacterium]
MATGGAVFLPFVLLRTSMIIRCRLCCVGGDSFGVFGPVIATDIDLATASIRAELNGRERQNYPVSDLLIQPAGLVSALSQDLTLYAGDIIACGTGPGALPMKPGATIDIIIDGIGTLSNVYDE